MAKIYDPNAREQIDKAVREANAKIRSTFAHQGRWHKKGGGGGGHIMAFEILDVDCDEGIVITDTSGIQRYTGCGTPPGANEYGSYEIEDYFGIVSDLTDPELIGQLALAIYWYDWVECENIWDLWLVTWEGGCKDAVE